LSFAVLFITLWKQASKSRHVLRGKRKHLDIGDIAPTPTADAADESNVEDRSAFCFSIRYCIIVDQHLKYAREYLCALRYVFANNYMNIQLGLLF